MYKELLHLTWFILYLSLTNAKVATHPFFSVSCNLLVILPSFRKLGKHFLCLVSALDLDLMILLVFCFLPYDI